MNGLRHRAALIAAAVLLAAAAVAAPAPAPGSVAMPGIAAGPVAVRAQLVPVRSTTVSSEMAGRIAELAPREGERFAAGDVLVRFACAGQQADLARNRATLEKKQRVHEVNGRLARLQSISKLELDVSAAEVAEAAAAVKVAEAVVGRCTIVAPWPGRVAERHVQRHQSVGEGQPLLDVLDDGALEIEMIVPSTSLAWLKPGHRFSLDIDETGHQYDAELERLGARVDPVSQSIKVYGRLLAAAPDLLAGMSGKAQLQP